MRGEGGRWCKRVVVVVVTRLLQVEVMSVSNRQPMSGRSLSGDAPPPSPEARGRRQGWRRLVGRAALKSSRLSLPRHSRARPGGIGESGVEDDGDEEDSPLRRIITGRVDFARARTFCGPPPSAPKPMSYSPRTTDAGTAPPLQRIRHI